ncbi:type IIB DNA topoisomerase family protein [Metarhizium robertsii]|uniref:DNA topoisomerase (ATP-hydrolyzing) n=2 Tax=Metarhizium robertsii TaxID=568076 RepID=A0A0A1UTX7_9HYPO
MTSNGHQASHVGSIPTEHLNYAGAAISRIESIFESVINNLLHNEPMSIALASRRSLRRRQSHVPLRQIQFPGRSAQEAQRFARVLLILQLSHDALVSGTVLTKRNIFYQHQELFGTQRVVDELVDDVATTLELDRDDLNIVASAKGIMAGPLRIRLIDGGELDASSDTGVVIPASRYIQSIDVGSLRWVLVIEKDATFRSLASTLYWEMSASGNGLLVTAKGYPDMITRSFLHLLGRQQPDIPIFVLTDFDPDGLKIFHCYLHGSGNILTDSTVDNPSFSWLGIRSSHLAAMDRVLQTSNSGSSQPPPTSSSTPALTSFTAQSAAVALTLRDRKMIVDTLKAFETEDGVTIGSLRRELQYMQVLGYKAEIQLLDDSGNLDSWLDTQIQIEMNTW